MSPASQIRNLIIVIGAGMMCALLLTYMMIANYGPSGNYTLSNLLLEPSLVEKISYQDDNTHYYFDRIEFMYFDQTANRWESQKLNQDAYQQIYQLLSSDQSIKDVTPETQSLFYTSKPASLTLVVHGENRENTKVFQEMQFEEHGDYYRIFFKDWIYFKHPKVLENIKKIVKP